MRIILIGVQLVVLSIMAFVTIVAGSGLASLPAVAAGHGPAAVGAGMYVLTLFAAATAGFVAVVLPGSLLAAATVGCAVMAGYRPLRWIRVLGVLVNCFAMGVVALPQFLVENYPSALTVVLLLYPVGNIVLFLLMPRVPNMTLTRRLCRVAVPCLYLPALATAVLVLTRDPSSWGVMGWGVIGLFLLLYLFPFYYAYRTLSHTKRPDRVLLVRMGWLALMAGLVLVLFFPLGLPLGMCLYLLLVLSEIAVLYPAAAPPEGSVGYWAAKALGRLPVRGGGLDGGA